MLKVATLNFTGINFSPFQFHDGSIQKQTLSQNFYNKLIKKFPNHLDKQFIKNGGNLDKITKKIRYSPLYHQNVGVINNKLLNKKEFDLIWDYEYQKNRNDDLKKYETKLIEQVKLFDYLIYQTLIQLIYSTENLKVQQIDSQKYLTQIKNWHNKDYLKLPPKIQKVKQFIIRNDLDVFFIQQCGFNTWNNVLPQGYDSKQNHDSLIIYKKKSFSLEEDVLFSNKYKQILNFNKDSVFIKLDNFFLSSIHLTSKKQNKKQAALMFQTLQQILKENSNLKIIIGTDANHYLQSKKDFNVFPTNQKQITTSKIRTYLQFQINKANKAVKQAKDHIITNLGLENCFIGTILNKKPDQSLIPNNQHPFDHFVVSSNIIIKEQNINIQISPIDQIQNKNNFQNHKNKSNNFLSVEQLKLGRKKSEQLMNQSSRSFDKSEILQDAETLEPFVHLIKKFTQLNPKKIQKSIQSQQLLVYKQQQDLSPIKTIKQVSGLEDFQSSKNIRSLLSEKKIKNNEINENQKKQLTQILKNISIIKQNLLNQNPFDYNSIVDYLGNFQTIKKQLQNSKNIINKLIFKISQNQKIISKYQDNYKKLKNQNIQLKQLAISCEHLILKLTEGRRQSKQNTDKTKQKFEQKNQQINDIILNELQNTLQKQKQNKLQSIKSIQIIVNNQKNENIEYNRINRNQIINSEQFYNQQKQQTNPSIKFIIQNADKQQNRCFIKSEKFLQNDKKQIKQDITSELEKKIDKKSN